ncbi:MarR family winged helix-turn-helix transcriptional regulator [Actinomadura harenae]|uniref:MarR family transcriptional regulator n=1 Tax=Actinomadura harenae TaxID=2483351 RepID=A0A3M2LPZ4_9ACTN|nr:MarR family transcriptional regulator [Actinomadura harenae]RMI39564.1 MarR family transcriptional regulator [Actinomadura harenae]
MTTETRADDLLRLDRQLCFSLHAASRAFTGVYRTVLKDLGLTYPQYLVMLTLWEHGELPVKEIGDRLRLDSGTLSPLLKRLETAGLVHRRRSEEDERSVVVTLTPEGEALRARAAGIPLHMARAAGLTLDEFQTLRTLLTTVTTNLDHAAL